MTTTRVEGVEPGWSGPATVLGGSQLIASAILTALKPEGCVGDACDQPGRSMRTGGALDAALAVTAIVLIGIGVVTMVMRARRAGRFGAMGRIGLVCAAAGLTLLAAGLLVQAVLFAGDFPSMPVVVLPGALAVVVGLVLLGMTVLRAGVLPRWVAALLIVGTLILLGFNDQDARALLAIPFGIAWMCVGYALWSTRQLPQMPSR